MKVILKNNITSVTATNENVNFPASLVLNESPKLPFKATNNNSTITCNCGGALDSIAIFGTNAESASITVTDPNEISWQDVTWNDLGDELITGWAHYYGYETFSSSNATITSAINSSSVPTAMIGGSVATIGGSHATMSGLTPDPSALAKTNVLPLVSGQSYQASITLTLNSGAAPKASTGTATNASGGDLASTQLSSGANILTFTYAETGMNYLWLNEATGTSNFSATTSLKPDYSVYWPTISANTSHEISTQASINALWGTLTGVTGGVIIGISLLAPDTLYVGAVVIGSSLTFVNPKYGLQQGLLDYSIEDRFQNGADYYKQRDIVRTFSGQIMPERDTAFYSFMHSFAQTYGKQPKAWKVTDNGSAEWIVYAKLSAMPQGTHAYTNYSMINFSLTEVI